MPCTPPPGGVEEEQMKIPCAGVEYGLSLKTGRVKSCRKSRNAAVDVAADVGWRSAARGRRVPSRSCQDALPEAGAKRLDLGLYPARSCRRSSRWGRGSRPRRCACPSGARVGSKRLCWASSRTKASRGAHLATRRPPRRDLIQSSAEVDGPGPQALLRLSRGWAVEREVHLEDARSVAVILEGVPVTLGEVLPRDVEQLARA